MTLGLGLIAQQEAETVGLAVQAMEAVAEQVVAVLGAGDCDIAVAEDDRVQEADGFAAVVVGLVEAGGEETGFEAGAAEDGLLSEGGAFEGEELLGVDGLVGGDEVVAETADFLNVLDADDGEGRTGEHVFAGVLGASGLALGGAWSGGFGGVGAIGGEAFGGDGAMGHSTLKGSRGMVSDLRLLIGKWLILNYLLFLKDW